MESVNFNSNDSKSIWNEMQLDKTETEGTYLITFTRWMESGNIVRKYKVSPVFSGTDYETAMKEYAKKFASYEQKKKEIEAQRVEAERQQRLALEKAKAEIKKQQLAAKYSGNNFFAMDASLNYVFTLNKLGWANIDRLYNSPASQPVDLQTFISNEESYESIYISLVFDKEKIFLPGYQKKDHSFGFSHNDNEKMVLPVGASAVLLATAYKDGEFHFVSKRITITDKMNITLNPLPTKEDELKTMLIKSI